MPAMRGSQRHESMSDALLSYDVSLKLFFDGAFMHDAVVPIFHRWIQGQLLASELLIDVVDYGHVHEGPKVLLIADGALYAIDEADGRCGLLHRRRRAQGRQGATQLWHAARQLVSAAGRLQGETDAPIRQKLRLDALEIRIADRLRAPNDDSSFAAWRPELVRLAEAFFAGEPKLQRSGDPRGPLSIELLGPPRADISQVAAAMAARLA